jgi:predicted acetyltransferase
MATRKAAIESCPSAASGGRLLSKQEASMEARDNVSVRPALSAERPLLEQLAQFYLYDFSELEPAESDRFEFDERGSLGTLSDLGDYWSQANFHPLLIRREERPVGFALLNTHSHRGGSSERNMGEFFVARKYRRHGVATEAVRQILALYLGCWEIAVTVRNMAAQAFWPQAIAAAPNTSQLLRLEGDGEHWRGPIWSFLAA